MMQKIVINDAIGGFSLSYEAVKWLAERKHALAMHCIEVEIPEFQELVRKNQALATETFLDPGSMLRDIKRDDPLFIECVRTLGPERASGEHALLRIVTDVPDGVKWQIEESDCGLEWIAEQHRTWGT